MKFSKTVNHCLVVTTVCLSTLSNAEQRANNAPLETSRHNCAKPESSEPDLCSQNASEAQFDFNSPPVHDLALQIDVRPRDCQSFFEDYLHTRRGLRIEDALQHIDLYSSYTSTVTTFPIVDFIHEGHIRVVKTRDLSADIFNNPNNENALFEQIMRDAESVQSDLIDKLGADNALTATVNGVTTTINSNDVTSITIDIVIQYGMASPTQILQLKQAMIEVDKRWGFTLQIIEIP